MLVDFYLSFFENTSNPQTHNIPITVPADLHNRTYSRLMADVDEASEPPNSGVIRIGQNCILAAMRLRRQARRARQPLLSCSRYDETVGLA